MNKEASLKLSAYISQKIINESPTINYSKQEIENERQKYSDEQLKKLEESGLYYGDFETFYVVQPTLLTLHWAC